MISSFECAADPLSTLGADEVVAVALLDELDELLDDCAGGAAIFFFCLFHIGAPMPIRPIALRGDDCGVDVTRGARGGDVSFEVLEVALVGGDIGGWIGKESGSSVSSLKFVLARAALISLFFNLLGCGVYSSGVSGKLAAFLMCLSRLCCSWGVWSARWVSLFIRCWFGLGMDSSVSDHS